MGITFRHGKFMKVVSQMTKGCEHCCTAELGPFLTHNAKEGVRILRVREPMKTKLVMGGVQTKDAKFTFQVWIIQVDYLINRFDYEIVEK